MITRGQVSITAGQSVSSSIQLTGTLAAVRPSSWTAAVITIQASFDNGVTWSDVYSTRSAGEYSLASAAVSAGKLTLLDPADAAPLAFALVRFRSGTSGTPVAQVAATSIDVVMQQFKEA